MSEQREDLSDSMLWRYGVALATCVFFLLLKLALRHYLGDPVPFILFFSTVMISAWFGGFGPGMLATALCTYFAIHYFIPGNQSFCVKTWPPVVFALEGTLVSFLSDSRRRVLRDRAALLDRERAERAKAEQFGQKLNTALENITREIDQRKQSEESLRASEERRRLALDAAEIGEWHMDPASMQLTTDQRFRAILGIATDEIEYDKAINIIHPEDLSLVLENVAAAYEKVNGEPFKFEHRVIHPDGSIHWVFVKGRANFTKTGSENLLTSFDGTVADITDRKAAQNLAITILESITEAFFSLDRNWKFTYVNRQAEHILDRKPGDLLGKIVWEEYPGLIGSEFEGVYRRAAEGLPGTVTAYYPDHKCWYEVHAYPAPTGISLYFRDVSDKKLIEEQQEKTAREREQLLAAERQARAEAERMSRLKDEFLATLSHELRTPLNAIVGWSQLLKRGGRNEEDLNEGIDAIERNARSQTQLIEDLLDMSRIIAGKVRLEVRPVEPADVVNAAIESVTPAAQAKGVRIEKTFDPDAGKVVGDPGRLQQIVWNLLINAVKFTDGGGEVCVAVTRANSEIQISVRDTGKGIKPQFLPFVFERFRQEDASTTRRHGGLGLGLSIVKHLVELHGGTVRAESAGEGQGATFTISLPRSAAVSQDHGKTQNPPPPPTGEPRKFTPFQPANLQGLKVLVVDDDDDSRQIIARMLAESEASMLTAASAAEGLEILQRERPDLLISDIGMPEIDGYEFARRVRRLPADQGGNTPAIALTAFVRAEDRQRALAAGYQLHVAKPVEPAELLTACANLTGAMIATNA